MNLRARCALVIVSCVLVCTASIAQEPPLDPEQLLREVFAAEKISDSGRLCFTFSFENIGDDVGITPEQRQTERVEFAWAPGKKFRLELYGKDGLLRTIVCDGKAIDTGEKVWDARFAFDYNPHDTDESFDLELDLQNEMWPYSHYLHLHLHPMSDFENVSTLEHLKLVYRIAIADKPASVDPNDTTLQLTGHRLRDMKEAITVRREAIPYVHTNRKAYGAGTDITLTYERAALRQVEGVGWIPSTLAIRYRDGDAPVVSALCAEQPDPSVEDAEFKIERGEKPYIPWPYGSPMKNFFYGIVNTFKDLWEGVSDGAIGN